MPEYLAPGVYVEEVSFRTRAIEGVSTTTTAFIGPCRYGPDKAETDVLTSVADFEQVFGDRGQLRFASEDSWFDPDDPAGDHRTELAPMHNYLWHAVRGFFENGGARLYVQRVFRELPVPDADGRDPTDPDWEPTFHDGRAAAALPDSATSPVGDGLIVKARFPGRAGERRVRLTLRLGPNVLTAGPDGTRVNALLPLDVVRIARPTSGPPGAVEAAFYWAEQTVSLTGTPGWTFHPASGATLSLDDLDPAAGAQVRIVTLAVTDLPSDEDAIPVVWSDLPLGPGHARAGFPDSVFARFEAEPANRAAALSLPIVVEAGAGIANGLDVLRVLVDYDRDLRVPASPPVPDLAERLGDPRSSDADRTVELALTGGNDGRRPTAEEYEGTADPDLPFRTGLKALEVNDEISQIAAPGVTAQFETGFATQALTVMNLLIGHAERMRYRMTVLDSGDGQTIGQVREMRAAVDSKYAALYYPWVRVLDPVTQREIYLPPSGFVTGIFARNDIQRGVYKAPANEVVLLALGFETTLNKAQQDVLNPEGVNCFRLFEGRGNRLWGARTVSSDPEWRYVNLRRYFNYLEHSIDRGTQWAVFEPNGERLWANVQGTIENFLLNEWQSGALLGDKPERAYFVKCDRSTMTQADLDNGRLVCLVGVAPLRPAEFVIFRIGQWTADRKV
jgi:uncharacterized protein